MFIVEIGRNLGLKIKIVVVSSTILFLKLKIRQKRSNVGVKGQNLNFYYRNWF